MRLWCALALLSACAAQTPARAPVAAAPVCPPARCPTCPAPSCPEQTCPPCPVAPTPAATEPPDWYCHDTTWPRLRISNSYCWVSEAICQSKQRKLDKKPRTRSGPCVSQRIAYCFQVTFTPVMLRQTLCSRTQEDCESKRQDFLKDTPVSLSSACQEMRNVDAFDTLDSLPVAQSTGDGVHL